MPNKMPINGLSSANQSEKFDFAMVWYFVFAIMSVSFREFRLRC